MILKDVRTLVDGWVFSGPLIALPEGLYFFVRESAYEGKLAEGVVKEALGVGAGFLGGLLVKAAASRVDDLRPRPAGLRLRPREEASAVYDKALVQAPSILRCRQFFMVPQEAVSVIGSPAQSVLAVEALGLTLFVEGLEAGVDADLRGLGYHVKKTPASLGKKASYLAAAAAGLLALAMGTVDLYEAHQAGTWLASKEGVRGVVFSGEDTRYIIHGREVRASDTGWLDRLPFFQLSIGLAMLVGGAYALSRLNRQS